MFLFIFESLGTSELLLIGVLALIFLGPRKMPEYARKLGKLMNDFKSTTNEFKETWEREVNFDEETKAFHADDEPPAVPRITAAPSAVAAPEPVPPAITAADPATFSAENGDTAEETTATRSIPDEVDINDRKNWL